MPSPNGGRDLTVLRDAVRSPAFTPAGKEVGTLMDLLGDAEEEVSVGAERAIARAGTSGPAGRVVERLVARLDEVSPEARAGAFRVIGRLAPTDAAAATAVIAGLEDPDARVKRAAAHALGRLRGSESAGDIAAAIFRAWDEVPELPLARALAEAMGKLGLAGPDAEGRLEAVEGGEGDKELARVARNALAMVRRDGTRAVASEIDGGRTADFDVDLVFFCRGGVESLLSDELRERCPDARNVKASPPGSGRVTARWRGAPNALFAVRTMLGFAFALPAERCASEADAEEACVRALTSETAVRIMEAWTRGTVRYRLDWNKAGHKRAATWNVVHAIARKQPGWVNDPTASTWQAAVDVDGGAVRVLLSPDKLADPRFAYRLRDVPAASHPTLAAALVRASRPRPDDVVWDPFVGSATELVERARAAPYARLIGTDTDAEALTAARTNVDAASVEGVVLESADATRHAPASVTCILTNPPMGRRVARDGSLAELLDAFTDNVARVLVPGGRLTWLSPLGGRTAARATTKGLTVSLRTTVDMGGFHAELQVWDKP